MTTLRTRHSWQPLVRLKDVEDFREPGDAEITGDRRDGKLYRYTETMKLHVNVAVATGRPLLLLGPTGCGKSSLAFNLARVMRRRYYEYVVTSRSEAKDLFYRFDAVRRLGDAHVHAGGGEGQEWRQYEPYITAGPLWWIVDPDGARAVHGAADPAVYAPPRVRNAPAVLLIDEIDKAEPDFANDLLVPLGSREFAIDELRRTIQLPPDANAPERAPVVIITSNRERDLPEAFVRRCIVLEIPSPREEDLVEVAVAVSGSERIADYRDVAQRLSALRGADKLSIAEYLDTLRALDQLRARGSAVITDILLSTNWRPSER